MKSLDQVDSFTKEDSAISHTTSPLILYEYKDSSGLSRKCKLS